MADKEESSKSILESLNCCLCTKLVKILRHKSEDHTDNETEVKCDDCGSGDPVVALCINCMLCLCEDCNKCHRKKKNGTHDIVLLNDACLLTTTGGVATKCPNEMVAPIEKMSELWSKTEEAIMSMKGKVQKQVKEVDEMIDKCYIEQLSKLNKHHQQLKKQLQDELSRKNIALTTQLEGIKSVQDNVKKEHEGLQKFSDCTVLSKKKDLEQEVSDKYKTLNPVETDSIEFVAVSNPNPLLGHLFTSAHPRTSEVVDLPQSIGYNTKVDFTIQTRNSKGEKCTKGGHHISVQLKSVTGNITIEKVKDNNDGSYMATFVAEKVGVAKLYVSINGHEIRGSPLDLLVGRNYQGIVFPNGIVNHNDVHKIQYTGFSHEDMTCPWHIAFNRKGTWILTDTHSRVFIFNGQDDLVRQIFISDDNKRIHSCGVAVDGDNYFYVTGHLHRNCYVQKFSINGNYLLQFGNDDVGKLSKPGGITTHQNKVYVVDIKNKHIAVFKTNGQFCTSFGSENLRGPTDVAVNINNQLLIADSELSCILIFTLDGKCVGKFGSQGSGKGQFNNPQALAIDPNGFILVADCGNHRISIFDKFGNYVDSFGSKGSNAGQFSNPRGIALSPNGSIYVSDSNNKRVQIF